MNLDEITSRLQRDFNAGRQLKEAYAAMQALRKSDSVKLADEIAWLQPLVERYKDDLPGFHKYLLDLLIARGERRTKTDGQGDHTILRDLYRLVYQTSLMAERRARVNKAIELYRRRGHTITNTQRSIITSKQLAHWSAQKEAYFKKIKELNGGMSWIDKCAATQKFWAAVDAQLDKQLRESE